MKDFPSRHVDTTGSNMRGIAAIFLVSAHLASCVTPSIKPVDLGYGRAIAEASFRETSDWRSDLHLCVEKWSDALAEKRTELLRQVLNDKNELKGDGALLEVGGSSWPRYDYIYVEGAKLKSSFANAANLDIAGTVLHKRLREISAQDLTQMTGRADSGAMDAPCYFLSVKKGAFVKSIAVYAPLGTSSADLLIGDLLSIVRNQTEPKL
jgi:hypothetical protein